MNWHSPCFFSLTERLPLSAGPSPTPADSAALIHFLPQTLLWYKILVQCHLIGNTVPTAGRICRNAEILSAVIPNGQTGGTAAGLIHETGFTAKHFSMGILIFDPAQKPVGDHQSFRMLFRSRSNISAG